METTLLNFLYSKDKKARVIRGLLTMQEPCMNSENGISYLGFQ